MTHSRSPSRRAPDPAPGRRVGRKKVGDLVGHDDQPVEVDDHFTSIATPVLRLS